jgi:hypothetical protein
VLDFHWVKDEPAQIELVVENYLPAVMVIDQLDFVSDKQLETKHETKYQIPARTTKRIVIDCVPKDHGSFRVEGAIYPLVTNRLAIGFVLAWISRPSISYLVHQSRISLCGFPNLAAMFVCDRCLS